jgi:hypothetical protein
VTVHVSSPQLAQYTALIQELDALMVAMDTLWLAGVLSNKQRANGSYEWRTRLLRTGRRIIDIERRARASAAARGKATEVAEADVAGAPGLAEAPPETPAASADQQAGPENPVSDVADDHGGRSLPDEGG